MQRPQVREQWTEETHIGPSSAQINIAEFLEEARESSLLTAGDVAVNLRRDWMLLTDDERERITGECDVSDIRVDVESILNDPAQRDALEKALQRDTGKLLHEEKPGFTKELREWAKKYAIEQSDNIDEDDLDDACGISERLHNDTLQCLGIPDDGYLYLRRSGAEYTNSLSQPKSHALTVDLTLPTSDIDASIVLITLTVYNPHVNRYIPLKLGSQHIFLGTHTLGDLVDVFPCSANDVPKEMVDEEGFISGYDVSQKMDSGCVLVMEEPWVHGDGMSDNDYADRYISWMNSQADPAQPLNLQKGSNLYETPFSSLPLRINYPYFGIHQGNCQHYFVIEQIRLRHPCDPPHSEFPFTVHHSPSHMTRPRCRICIKLPATISVIGDIRLGESPCIICKECWAVLGDPTDTEEALNVVVVPLTAGDMYFPSVINAMTQAQKIGSLLFCPDCGTLLDLPKDDNVVECRQCGRPEPASCKRLVSKERFPFKTH